MATQDQLYTYFESIGVMFEDAKDKNTLTSVIESKSFRAAVKRNLPKTSAKYGTITNTPTVVQKLTDGTKIDKKLTNYIRSNLSSKSKNLKVTVYQIPEKLPNAFTIPGIHLGMDDLTLSDLIFGSFHLKKYDFQASPSGRKVTLTSNKPVEPLLVATSGLSENKTLTDNEKMAVFLHELGHWSSDAASYQMLGIAAPALHTVLQIGTFVGFIAPMRGDTPEQIIVKGLLMLAVSLIIMIIAFHIEPSLSRSAEFKADAFAKKAGRGQDLSDALQKMEGSTISSKSELNETASFLDKISPIIDFLTRSSHPSTYRRSDRLLESHVVEEGVISDMTNNIAEKTLKLIAAKLDDKISSKPIVPLLWAFGDK